MLRFGEAGKELGAMGEVVLEIKEKRRERGVFFVRFFPGFFVRRGRAE